MENIINSTRAWVQGETTEAIIIIAFGVLTIFFGIVVAQFGKVPGAKALFLPLVIVGAAYTLIGSSNLYTNHGRFEGYEREYRENPETFVQKEKARVESFQYMYKISKAVATVFFLATIIIFWSTKNPTWQGIGMGLTLFGLAGLAVDYFSQNRADAYYDVILKTIGA